MSQNAKALLFLGWIIFCIIFGSTAGSYMSTPAQIALSVFLALAGWSLWFIRKGPSYLRTAMQILTATAALRYITWRCLHTLNLTTFYDGFASVALLLAECYSVYILLGFYFQTLSLDRLPDETPPDPDYLPSVDIFIATYNEPVAILRRTACCALSVDYPNKTVYILDDGRRPEMRKLAEEVGCEYFDRPNNRHAKSGNLNNALKKTKGEFVLFLDADHLLVKTFLHKTIHFFKDPKVALVQGAHRFINPSAVERNLGLEGVVPHEQELFFQLVQTGNNLWNASFFCGSAALIRRSELEAIGGFPTETITEDEHTSIRLHRRGTKSVYVSELLGVGLSAEDLNGFVIQHCRWAKGAMQMLLLEKPLFNKELTWPQRICYFNAMTHFFYGIPRITFYLAPMAFLFFGLHPVKALLQDYLIIGMPYIALSLMSNNWIFKNFRYSFWSDAYEAVMAPFYAWCTTAALICPKGFKFDVTPKGLKSDRSTFYWPSVYPNVFILSLLAIALFTGIYQLLHATTDIERGPLYINIFWTMYNSLLVLVAVLVGIHPPLARQAQRIKRTVQAKITDTENQLSAQLQTEEMSEFGCDLNFPDNSDWQSWKVGSTVQLALSDFDFLNTTIDVSAKVRRKTKDSNGGYRLGLEFIPANDKQVHELIELVYCNPSNWTEAPHRNDSLSRSFWLLLTTPSRMFALHRDWIFEELSAMLHSATQKLQGYVLGQSPLSLPINDELALANKAVASAEVR